MRGHGVEGGREIKARHVLIATGTRPVPLGIPGEEHVITSDDFLELETLPRRIVLIGGGYIAAEFSHLAVRAGAEVTILQRGPRMLPRFDADLVGWLMESFTALGIHVRTDTSVTWVERAVDGFLVHAAAADGQEQVVAADLVVHAAGRAPDLDALDPEAAGVRLDQGRLALNEFLQSVSNPRVYAAGDAAGSGPPLTLVSSHDAKVVAGNLLESNRHRPDYRGVPSVAFTLPPIAAVGLGEEARAQGLRVWVKSERVPGWFTARRLAEPVYGYKTLVEEGSGRVLGAHLVGQGADEAINVFALAIRHGLTAADLKATMFAYPTGASDVGYML